MDESVQKNLKPQLDEVSQLLLRAAQQIELHGHCKGVYWQDGRSCALGALIDAGQNMQARQWAAERLAKSVGSVPDWNDHPERTQQQVVAKLRAVALGG